MTLAKADGNDSRQTAIWSTRIQFSALSRDNVFGFVTIGAVFFLFLEATISYAI